MLQAKGMSGKRNLTGFSWIFNIYFPQFKKKKRNFAITPSLCPNPSPATELIFTYIWRHSKVFSNKTEVSNPFFLCIMCIIPTTNTGWTRRRKIKNKTSLSYDVSLLDTFLDSDLFRRWFCNTSSSSGTGTTRVSGSAGYWPNRR